MIQNQEVEVNKNDEKENKQETLEQVELLTIPKAEATPQEHGRIKGILIVSALEVYSNEHSLQTKKKNSSNISSDSSKARKRIVNSIRANQLLCHKVESQI
jgi:hypothetical protein